jgi:hypothetical protein
MKISPKIFISCDLTFLQSKSVGRHPVQMMRLMSPTPLLNHPEEH